MARVLAALQQLTPARDSQPVPCASPQGQVRQAEGLHAPSLVVSIAWCTQGVVATVGGREVAVGNSRLLAGQGIRVDPDQAAAEAAWQAKGILSLFSSMGWSDAVSNAHQHRSTARSYQVLLCCCAS